MIETKLALGQTDIRIAPLGVGTWQWGDTAVWNYGKSHSDADITAAFWHSLNAGITFFDTAEVYGNGQSERILGKLTRSTEEMVVVATKFAPLPWRLKPQSVRAALEKSLERLGVSRIDLYQIHWPFPLITIPKLMDALADAVADGLVRAVGVSNYSAAQMAEAQDALSRRGVPLASNQVEYSLLARGPEVNGVLDTCRALGITLIAYSPLAMGLLTGKYKPGVVPGGARRLQPRFNEQNLIRAEPLIHLLNEIGAAHGGKTPAQVALNWLIQHDTLPIPGAKNAKQAEQNAGALGWALTQTEVAMLDEASQGWRKATGIFR